MDNNGGMVILLSFLLLAFLMFGIIDYGIYSDDSVFERYFELENTTSYKMQNVSDEEFSARESEHPITDFLVNLPIIGGGFEWFINSAVNTIQNTHEGIVNFLSDVPGFSEAIQFFNMAFALITLDFTFLQDLGMIAWFIKMPFLFLGIYAIARLFRGGG